MNDSCQWLPVVSKSLQERLFTFAVSDVGVCNDHFAIFANDLLIFKPIFMEGEVAGAPAVVAPAQEEEHRARFDAWAGF